MDKFEFYKTVGKELVRDSLAERETPCYVYFKKMIEKRLRDLRDCLPDFFNVYYAVKANPNSEILSALAKLGIGADVASLGELRKALATGINPDKIEFSGPGKTEDEIRFAVLHDISSINAESLSELQRIAEIGRELGKVANVGIRINPDPQGVSAGLSMSGDSQFGIREGLVGEALKFLKMNSEHVRFVGIHAHTGSQILSADSLIKNFAGILNLGDRIESLGVCELQKINFGGGWGIKYFPNQKNLDLGQVRDGLRSLFQENRYARFIKSTKLIVEPGRFLVGESGVYVTKVLYVKRGIKKEFLIVDGGMHHHYLLAGGMGQVVRRNFEADVLFKRDTKAGTANKYDIAGRLCTPQDILAVDILLDNQVGEGDYIVFFNSGAYGLSASPVNFLCHEPPEELLIG